MDRRGGTRSPGPEAAPRQEQPRPASNGVVYDRGTEQVIRTAKPDTVSGVTRSHEGYMIGRPARPSQPRRGPMGR